MPETIAYEDFIRLAAKTRIAQILAASVLSGKQQNRARDLEKRLDSAITSLMPMFQEMAADPGAQEEPRWVLAPGLNNVWFGRLQDLSESVCRLADARFVIPKAGVPYGLDRLALEGTGVNLDFIGPEITQVLIRYAEIIPVSAKAADILRKAPVQEED